uniref:F-box domain-containing protein n=1 Tax=Mycena chlorophos TaxID=658473 RepID=A0ABQ0M1V6_MYCCL|nr:predicted protein [Mycena chlorophos]
MPVLPPELEAHIILNHVDDTASLRACALACGRLCYWAQSRLFATITTYSDWDCSLSWAKRVERLVDILSRSPYLLLHVRSLVLVDSYPALLGVFATQRWKSLARLELHIIPEPSEEVVTSIQRLISGPSLQMLRLGFYGESWDSVYLSRILAYCSPTLANLDISHCSGSTSGPPLQIPSTLNFGSPRAQIRRLRLADSPAAVAALDADILPLDFTHVQEVVYSKSPHASLNSLLRRSKAHLSLKVDPKDCTLTSFDFSLPSLHTLECTYTPRTAHHILPRIPRTSRLTTLTLTASPDDWDPELQDQHQLIGALFDDQLLERFHRLRVVRVEVKMSLSRLEEELSTTELTLAIEGALPKLANAGMLAIIFT